MDRCRNKNVKKTNVIIYPSLSLLTFNVFSSPLTSTAYAKSTPIPMQTTVHNPC